MLAQAIRTNYPQCGEADNAEAGGSHSAKQPTQTLAYTAHQCHDEGNILAVWFSSAATWSGRNTTLAIEVLAEVH